MFQMVTNAISMGYTTSQILQFISKKVSGMSGGISNAKNSGYSDDDILKFISKKFKKGNNPEVEEAATDQEQYLNNIGIKTKTQRQESLRKGIGTAIDIGSTALGAYALYRAMPSIVGKVSEMMGGASGSPNTPGAPTNPQAPQSNPKEPTPSAPQSPMPQVPSTAPMPVQGSGELIEKLGIGDKIKTLQNAGNSPEQIAAILEFVPGHLALDQKKFIKQNGMDLMKSIEDYISKAPVSIKAEQVVPEDVEPIEIQEEMEVSPKMKEPANRKKVLLPNGDLGEVESTKNGIAKIDVGDGKFKTRKEEDLISSPIPEEDMADLYERAVKSIPEAERSAVINWAGYDDNHNELAFKPHTGALYVYKDIPKEFADKLKDAMFQAKTTGSNFYGAWSQGEASRGAGLSVLIRDLQKEYGGKGKEYVRKYGEIHDLFRLPKEEIARRQKRKRDEERARKKAEKDKRKSKS